MAKKKIDEKRLLPVHSDIYKEGDNVILEMEMPGVSKDGLEIKVDGDHLFVEGRKDLKKIEGGYRIHEIRDGNYHQVFTLDETIDRNKIDAGIKNGVVTITLGMKESEKPRRIEVVAK